MLTPSMLMKQKIIFCDLETKDLTARYDKDCPIWCVGIADNSTGKYQVLNWCESTIHYLNYEVTDGTNFVFHNHSFDVAVLETRNIHIPQHQIHDTMCMSYVLRPDSSDSHSLEALAPLVGMQKVGVDDFSQDSPLLRKRNLSDLRITRRLFHLFMHEFENDDVSWDYYLNIEMPYGKMIRQMQRGINIDTKYVEAYAEKLAEKQDIIYSKLLEKVPCIPTETTSYKKKVIMYTKETDRGVRKPVYSSVYNGVFEHCKLEQFNPNSGAHIAYALTSLYNWKPTKFTKTETPSTDVDTLTELSPDMSMCKDILEYKKCSKLLSTFVPPLLNLDGGKVRASFNQYTTVTRRLSSSKPNLQNIPARDEEGAAIRRAFVAAPGKSLVCGDLDRIEVVILAWYLEYLFGDTTLSSSVRQGIDVHQVNADLWGISRKIAKNTFFCILYGGGEKRIAETAKISREAASDIFFAIQDKLPALLDFRDVVAEKAEKNKGLLYDLFGGRIYVPDIMSERHDIYASAKRKVANYTVQGTAGSLFKILQLDADDWIVRTRVELDLLIVVHDEAVYECDTEIAQYCADNLTRIFTTDSLLDFEGITLPVKATFGTANNWLEAKGE